MSRGFPPGVPGGQALGMKVGHLPHPGESPPSCRRLCLAAHIRPLACWRPSSLCVRSAGAAAASPVSRSAWHVPAALGSSAQAAILVLLVGETAGAFSFPWPPWEPCRPRSLWRRAGPVVVAAAGMQAQQVAPRGPREVGRWNAPGRAAHTEAQPGGAASEMEGHAGMSLGLWGHRPGWAALLTGCVHLQPSASVRLSVHPSAVHLSVRPPIRPLVHPSAICPSSGFPPSVPDKPFSGCWGRDS